MRASGILLALSSLPSPYGIGTLGRQAYEFIDFLRRAGQRFWQILPIGPTGYGDSPYQSFSAFAANPYLIDLDLLIGEGLLRREEAVGAFFGDDPQRVDYGALYANRLSVLRCAVARLGYEEPGFCAFRQENGWWLDDYALFMALKAAHGMVSFQEWPDRLRRREEDALIKARREYGEDVRFWEAVQYLFYRQWEALKAYANQNGVEIIGDIPIYVSPDSSDLWADPELFQVGEDGRLREVAGCPPDAFSKDGQLWGNPLYDWDYHKGTGYRWWIRRLRHASRVYDVVRIDHFRGFESYYSIPAGEETAIPGHWRPGPGLDFIETLRRQLPGVRIIAEDLGYLTDEVRRLLLESGFPGMKVLQFAFDSRESGDYLPHGYRRNAVCYTGTHDNTTTVDWEHSAPPADVAYAREYLGVAPGGGLCAGFIRAALSSVCDTCVIPMQDWLHLGGEARMNTPSTLGGNWVWRMEREAMSGELADSIAHLTRLYGRENKGN